VTEKPEARMFTGPKTLDDIHARLEDCWADNGHVPESIRNQVAIAVAEIVANIVEHAAQAGPVLMHMSIEVRDDEVHVSFTDDGSPCPVDPDEANMPDEFADRRRGIPMIRAVLSKLSYHRSPTHNHWRLVSRSFGSGAARPR